MTNESDFPQNPPPLYRQNALSNLITAMPYEHNSSHSGGNNEKKDIIGAAANAEGSPHHDPPLNDSNSGNNQPNPE